MLTEVRPTGVQGGAGSCSQEDWIWWRTVRLTVTSCSPVTPRKPWIHKSDSHPPYQPIITLQYQEDQQQSCSRAKSEVCVAAECQPLIEVGRSGLLVAISCFWRAITLYLSLICMQEYLLSHSECQNNLWLPPRSRYDASLNNNISVSSCEIPNPRTYQLFLADHHSI